MKSLTLLVDVFHTVLHFIACAGKKKKKIDLVMVYKLAAT